MFYVYEWYIKETNEIIYVGKGSKNRYKSKQHNKVFLELIYRFKCESRIIEYFNNEQDAYKREYERICELKSKNQCKANIVCGGNGGGASMNTEMKRWNDSEKLKYSKYNVMKSEYQRKRMSINNPMKNKEIAKIVGIKHRKPFYIENKKYETLKDAAFEYKVTPQRICQWINKGYTSKNEKIYR